MAAGLDRGVWSGEGWREREEGERKREKERWRGIRRMAFTEARMIRRKVILLVVRQSSFPLNPDALLFILVAILRATEPGIPYYPHRRACFRVLTTRMFRGKSK